ncbi:MAG: hypothetical protein H6594_06980 [Flavobacteriales bacterium]|nr:hypothetical protein [Flavobacteriales bacterium]
MAANRAAPKISLGVLFIAAQFMDLLWPTLVLLGVEHFAIVPGITQATPLDFTDYPVSHGLLAVFGWSVLAMFLARGMKQGWNGALVLGVCLLSHWLLDLIVHRPDLPLVPGSDMRVGLGLWNVPWAALALELLLNAVGVGIYLHTTRSRDRIGRFGFWTLVLFLLAIHLMNVFGPVPTSTAAVAWSAQLQWLFVAWAFWVDGHREERGGVVLPHSA